MFNSMVPMFHALDIQIARCFMDVGASTQIDAEFYLCLIIGQKNLSNSLLSYPQLPIDLYVFPVISQNHFHKLISYACLFSYTMLLYISYCINPPLTQIHHTPPLLFLFIGHLLSILPLYSNFINKDSIIRYFISLELNSSYEDLAAN